MFVDRLIDAIKEKNNPSVIGLDTKLEYVPDYITSRCFKEYGQNLLGAAEAVFEFNKVIIEAAADYVAVVKPQIAYYEMYGVHGVETFNKTVAYAKKHGLLVIGDAKRNDIGSTAECYATAFLGRTKVGDNEFEAFPVDALTVNPYLGYDGIKPFAEACEKYGKGIFVLVKTSNPSSKEFQDVTTSNGERMYEVVAKNLAAVNETNIGKNGYCNIGAVVGATYHEEAKTLREIMPRSYILVPGYGAQGGKAADLTNFFNKDGLGAVVNSSRDILLAYKKENSAQNTTRDMLFNSSRNAVIRMRDDINSALQIK